MSKKLYALFAVVFAFASCNCQKPAVEENTSTKEATMNLEKLPKFEYVANTRGFYQKITIENKIVTVSSDREGGDKGQAVPLSDADVNELNVAIQNIKWGDLGGFKDPTQKRFYDGAAIATLRVTINGDEYQSVDFDHGFPPVEIEKLVNKIVSFGKK